MTDGHMKCALDGGHKRSNSSSQQVGGEMRGQEARSN